MPGISFYYLSCTVNSGNSERFFNFFLIKQNLTEKTFQITIFKNPLSPEFTQNFKSKFSGWSLKFSKNGFTRIGLRFPRENGDTFRRIV
jgi:hypothetical protein